MDALCEKFSKLGIENAPGQEKAQKERKIDLRGEIIEGKAVDFSHGDVDAFEPLPGSLDCFINGYKKGGKQAYTEYRGSLEVRKDVAEKISRFTGTNINPEENIILTPGTQGALFLAMGSMIGTDDKVAIVEPDYFANRKLVEFFGGKVIPVELNYKKYTDRAGIDLEDLEEKFKGGVSLFIFSNPNNPLGVIYSAEEIAGISSLAKRYHVSLIVDELYSRQIFDNRQYTHLCAMPELPDQVITIIGPSKTESLSGFRLGTAFGNKDIILRMEKLQAIVSLRTAGYCQAVYQVWFNEPEGYMQNRIKAHQEIRDGLFGKFTNAGYYVRKTEAGSYLFVELPELEIPMKDFTAVLRKLAGVTVTPGEEFGPQFTRHFRINFSQDREAAFAAADRIIDIVKRYVR
ncbi:MAG: pyridoxal phosphate-dependent aminotransferase [Clostridiales bacterium]|nr:pyridoxal phosphate-dependent aminotransferase [Clostridiales bacterium]